MGPSGTREKRLPESKERWETFQASEGSSTLPLIKSPNISPNDEICSGHEYKVERKLED